VKVRKQLARTSAVAAALAGISAIVAATIIGLGAYPSQTAQAAVRSDSTGGRYMAVPVVRSADAAASSIAANGLIGSSARYTSAGLRGLALQASPANLSRTLGIRPLRPLSERIAPPATKPRPKAKAKPKVKALAGGPWRAARCSTYGIGDGLVGSGLAGGGHLHADSMIVAHKTMRFGTKIQFSYHGHTTIAIVKDRGPYIHGRVFDLGPGTARALGFDGVGSVKYRILSK
jgi:hypothetical protein